MNLAGFVAFEINADCKHTYSTKIRSAIFSPPISNFVRKVHFYKESRKF